MFPIDIGNLREDGTYGSIVEKKIDADGQLDLFGKPVLNKEFIMKEILSV